MIHKEFNYPARLSRKIATNIATKTMKGIVKRKNGYFYFRKNIPEDLRAESSAREFLVSLGTKSETEAKIKADPLLKLSSYLLITARRDRKKIMFRQTSTKFNDLCLDFMASVTIGDMQMTFEGETNEVIGAISKLKESKPTETVQTFNSEFILSRKDEYLNYLKKMKYSPQTIHDIKYTFNEFEMIMGDKRIEDINIKLIKKIIKAIFSLPSQYDNKRGLQAILLDGKQPRGFLTSKNYVSRLKRYFSYLVSIDLLESNPLNSDLYPSPPRSMDVTNYANFTKSDLEKIFSDSLVNGSKYFAYHYWVTVLSLFTGARASEILQLRLTDVFLEAEIPYININNSDDKFVKNKSSIRSIPIHPKLLDLGFKNYCEQIKNEKYEVLFPDNSSLYIKKPANALSVWFNKYLLKLQIEPDNKRRKVFHSFRHTFITELQRINAPLEIRQSIAGHATGIITIDVYGEKSQLEKMYDWIKRIDYKIDIPILKNTVFHKRKRKEVFSKHN